MIKIDCPHCGEQQTTSVTVNKLVHGNDDFSITKDSCLDCQKSFEIVVTLKLSTLEQDEIDRGKDDKRIGLPLLYGKSDWYKKGFRNG